MPYAKVTTVNGGNTVLSLQSLQGNEMHYGRLTDGPTSGPILIPRTYDHVILHGKRWDSVKGLDFPGFLCGSEATTGSLEEGSGGSEAEKVRA